MPNRLHEDTVKRTSSSKHFLNDDGSYTAEISSGPLHYQNGDGLWTDIDTTVVTSDDLEYDLMCATTDIPVYFKKEISGAVHNIKIVKDGVTVKLKSSNSLSMQDKDGNKTLKELAKSKPAKVAEKSNKVRYPSIISQSSKNINIDYDVIAGLLHEEFVVDDSLGFPEIEQEIEVTGGYAQAVGKAIRIVSNATGQTVLTLPAPVMFEKNNVSKKSFDLVYETSDLSQSIFTVKKVLEPAGKDWFFSPDRSYPLVVDTDFTATASANGGITGSSSSYATARSTASWYTPDGSDIYVGQYYAPPYAVDRSYLRFSTGSIASSATISSVTMTLTSAGDLSHTDFDVQIVDYDWSSYDPITGQEAAYDGCLSATLDNVWINTSGMSIDTPYTSSALSTSWINKQGTSGITYYGLRSKRDYDNVTPTGYERVTIYSYTIGISSWRPKLNVTYTLTSAPTVTTSNVTNPATSSGTGNGNITATGGANATVRGFCYKIGNSGDPTTADSTAYDSGDFGTGAYTKNITGLIPGTSYRVRAYATNSAGTGYGSTVSYVALPTGAGLLMLLAS